MTLAASAASSKPLGLRSEVLVVKRFQPRQGGETLESGKHLRLPRARNQTGKFRPVTIEMVPTERVYGPVGARRKRLVDSVRQNLADRVEEVAKRSGDFRKLEGAASFKQLVKIAYM